MTMVSCSVAQPIILHASTTKRRRPIQYLTGYKRKGKAYKKEKVFCMYIGKMLVDLFRKWTFIFFIVDLLLTSCTEKGPFIKKVDLYCKKWTFYCKKWTF